MLQRIPSIFIALIVCQTASAQKISFNRDVRPIITDKCFHCHGPDANNQESDFRLDTREHALKAISAGNVEGSELHARIRAAADDESVMPPAEETRQLTDEEKDIIDRWVEQGAPFEGHWAFEPIPDSVSVPEAKDRRWPNGDIDRFILDAITKEGLKPNAAAPKEKWLRRVTFDLSGLPPTIEELDAFLADESETAHETVVDRLLTSDQYAERLTTEWLDVARYSDSYGYQRDDPRHVWPYRDWVIRAFKQNMPYDQFITWQLAGDLMEDPTQDQIIATVFNRLHSHKKEGGTDVEEFRVENVADRTHTFSTAFLGLTMECARCHDHKYDPTKTKEYYQLSSYFANVDENGLISYFTDAVPTPAAPLPTAEQKEKLASAQKEIDAAESRYRRSFESESQIEFRPPRKFEISGRVAKLTFDQAVSVWKKIDDKEKEKSEPEDPGVDSPTEKPWNKTAQKIIDGKFGKAIELTGDDPVTFPGVGRFGRHEQFTVSIWIKASELDERGVIWRRSRGWDDAGSIGYELTKIGDKLIAKMCHFWPGNAIAVETDSFLEKNHWFHIAVTYDGSSKAEGLNIFVDGKPAKTMIVKDHLTRQVSRWRGGYEDFAIGSRYRDRGFKDGAVDEFQMFDRVLADVEIVQLHDGKTLDRLWHLHRLSVKATKILSKQEKAGLRSWYLAALSERMSQAREKLKQARFEWNKVMDSIPAMMVMRETETPRDAFVLERGVYDSRGEKVNAATPEFLPDFPRDAPNNRLGLAKWTTSPDHPLTARVTVNRYWQMMFANGLVRTPEDFGLQSQMPSHPELLDWLARDFISNGWDVRRLLKMIALSSTYRQQAAVSPEVRNRDPENVLLARAPANRITAEMLRDGVLFTSGQLNQKVGGPPVKPYDVALAYNAMKADRGQNLYRRSLYTFWKRSSPAPTMMTLDANKRDVCRLRRESTASPLQALVLLNGTQFVEASKALAIRLYQKHDGSLEKMIEESFRLMTSRSPSEEELTILKALYEDQLGEFESEPERANELLKTGESKIAAEIPPARLAAATVLVNAIINLDESVRLQ